jgi:hypothetical protein
LLKTTAFVAQEMLYLFIYLFLAKDVNKNEPIFGGWRRITHRQQWYKDGF